LIINLNKGILLFLLLGVISSVSYKNSTAGRFRGALSERFRFENPEAICACFEKTGNQIAQI
jgi:hypothetical protein